MDTRKNEQWQGFAFSSTQSMYGSGLSFDRTRCSKTLRVTAQGSASGNAPSTSWSGSSQDSNRLKHARLNARRNARRKIARQARKEAQSLPHNDQAPSFERPRMDDPNPFPGSFQSAPDKIKEALPSFETACSITMAIIKDDYPVNEITEEEMGTLQCEILERIDWIPSGNPLPLIKSFNLVGGAMIYLCGDLQTGTWLRNEFNQNERVLAGTRLLVSEASELPKLFKVAFKTRDVWTRDPAVLLRRMFSLNTKLNTGCWRAVNSIVTKESINWIFLMDVDSVNAIKEADYSAYTGLDKGIFKVLSEPYKTHPQSGAMGQDPEFCGYESSRALEDDVSWMVVW